MLAVGAVSQNTYIWPLAVTWASSQHGGSVVSVSTQKERAKWKHCPLCNQDLEIT